MDDFNKPRCRLSHPAFTHHNLSLRREPVIKQGCFTCGGKYTVKLFNNAQYDCTTCGVKFHYGCHERPRRITHPYHLQHPLTLFYRHPETGTISNIIPDASPSDITTDEDSDTADEENSNIVDIVPSKSNITFDKCTWCGKGFEYKWFYRCLICSFCLDLPCAKKVPPLTIANPKGHHHSLLFLPRPLLVPCDVCGLVDALEPSYTCFQCNYMAHQSCIDLPRVIKLTRHPHRLYYIPYRSPLSSTCRICYKDVDVKYGQYSCNHEGCSYVAHSKCATHWKVWDKTELEWEPEDDSDEAEEAPFKKLGDGFIKHFGHEHPLKLKKHDGVADTEKHCDACVYHIVSTNQFYHCEGCDYSLHEVCAGLPRKLDHALHNHTLFLDPSSLKDNDEYNYCSVCYRESTGFRYICSKKACRRFSVDVRCISVAECFTHKSHDDHPVYISTTSYNGKDDITCKRCKKSCGGSPHLHCTVCEYVLCYTCGTIPDEIHYKYDKHLLTLSYGEESSGDDEVYWCEVCETLLDPKEWFYTCHECCTTIHLECIFGSSFFMKPGSRFCRRGRYADVLCNSSNTRKLCYTCKNLCTGSIYYEAYHKHSTLRIHMCSLKCLFRVMTNDDIFRD